MFGRPLFSVLLAAILLPVVLAGYEGAPIGGEPYASWEKGAIDYFVLFNSLIDDQVTLYGEGENRQGDTCLLESFFTLNNFHTPDDAIVIQAYLVWMGAVDPANLMAPTDNSVHLKFAHASSGYTYEEDIIAGDEAKILDDTNDPFMFQSVQFNADVTTGCTETEPGTAGPADVAYFTYRTDITPFFQKVFDDNRIAEEPVPDGEALYGDYTFSGFDCTDNDIYKCRTTMVSNWSILLVYRSEKVKTKKIYLYPGLAYAQGEATTANVSGFTLPRNPFVRLTAMTAEGYPALVDPVLPPELIYIKGEDATSHYPLTNDCNPLTGMSYEVYNSNSSLFGWDVDNEGMYCLDGSFEDHYFGVDVDTFLLDSEGDINLQEHLKLGGTNFDVTISVNKDDILMNYLIVSVDTKAPLFDIPPEALRSLPHGREKQACTCRRSEDPENAYCADRPMYYLIRVQNWGTNVVNNVVVVDDLDGRVDYVSGTTEMATKFDGNGNGVLWTTIPDKAGTGNDAFPLSGDGYKVADTMDICNQATWTCTDTRLIRFRVVPKQYLPPNEIISNVAIIKEAGSAVEYRTNSNNELRLYKGVCKEPWVCSEPTKEDCGGICSDPECNCCNECSETNPCPEGYVCDLETGECIFDPPPWCNDITLSTEVKDAQDLSAPMIIPAGTEDLVLGRFRIATLDCPYTKFFKFVSLRVAVIEEDINIRQSNMELIYDENGNGKVDEGEEVLAVVAAPDSYGAYFVLDQNANLFSGGEPHDFLIRSHVGYEYATIPNEAIFNVAIESNESFAFETSGTVEATGAPLSFNKFQVESSGPYFIVTRGLNDPSVPEDVRQDIPLLQLRTKSLSMSDKIRRIVVSTAGEEYATFGKNGIRALSLYLDTTGDGVPDGEPIATVTSFASPTEAVFEGEAIESQLTFEQGEDRFLIINGDLTELPGGETARLVVKRGDVVTMNTTRPIYGPPVYSKEFYQECSLQDCEAPDDDTVKPKDDGCGCSVVF